MPADLQSVIDAEMAALEFQEAAWRARQHEAPPPDASALPDLAIEAILRYEKADLPGDAKLAVVAEATRRWGFLTDRLTRWLAWGAVVMPAVGGAVAVWILLGP
ncbi:MAG: hypothetical protein ACXWXN_08835 [Actinomycetota bacterium]